MTNTYSLVSTSSNWQLWQRNCVFSGMTIDWQSSWQRVQGHLFHPLLCQVKWVFGPPHWWDPPLLICWHQPTALHKHYHRHHLHHNRWQFWGWERYPLNLIWEENCESESQCDPRTRNKAIRMRLETPQLWQKESFLEICECQKYLN